MLFTVVFHFCEMNLVGSFNGLRRTILMVYPRLLMYIKNTDRLCSENELGFVEVISVLFVTITLVCKRISFDL